VEVRKSSSFIAILITSIVLFVVGAAGLVVLFNLTVPTLGPRWLMFFLITMAVSGLMLLPAYFLNIRFPSNPPADAGVLLREAIFMGVYVDLLIWLQFGKVLNFAIGLFILVGFALIEGLLRWRERSRFTPGGSEEQQ
jgi:hypothetical protein